MRHVDDDQFEDGQWNVACPRCGAIYKARQLRLQPNGLRVCDGPGTRGCYDPKHPQDRVAGRADKQTVPWASPAPAPLFIGEDVPPVTQEDL